MSVEQNVLRARRIVAEGVPIGPRLYPCVCGAGKHEHGGTAFTGGCKRTRCRRYRSNVVWDLVYRAIDAQARSLGDSLKMFDRQERDAHYKAKPRQEGHWSIGASDTQTCPRKIQYRNKPPDDFVAAPEDKRPARAGTIWHTEVTRQMRALYPWREFAGKVAIPGLDRESEFDSYDPITCEVEDYKSAGEWKWDDIGPDGPGDDVWEQVMLYALAIAASGREVRTVRLSYWRRSNGHDEFYVRDYDEQMAKAALDRLLGYATALDLDVDLPKTGTGPSNDGLCRGCFARWHCWNMDAAEARGRSPESFTVLGAEPADPDVIWAVGNRVETQQARLDAEKAEKEAKVLLEGVEYGRYGPYEGYEKAGGGGDDPAAYAKALAAAYDLPDGERPALADIPVPQKRRYKYPSWGKVRKATLERERKERAALDTAGSESEGSQG